MACVGVAAAVTFAPKGASGAPRADCPGPPEDGNRGDIASICESGYQEDGCELSMEGYYCTTIVAAWECDGSQWQYADLSDNWVCVMTDDPDDCDALTGPLGANCLAL
jgi:hypothetical protein